MILQVTSGRGERPPAAVVNSNVMTSKTNARLQGAISATLRADPYPTQSPGTDVLQHVNRKQ
jgi:hypothetical protein